MKTEPVIPNRYLALGRNPLTAPAGSLLVGNNIRLDNENTIRQRRGQWHSAFLNELDETPSVTGCGLDRAAGEVLNYRAEKMFWFNNAPFVHLRHNSSPSTYQDIITYLRSSATAWRSFRPGSQVIPQTLAGSGQGIAPEPSKYKISQSELAKRAFITSSAGVLYIPMLDDDTAYTSALSNAYSPQINFNLAGAPRGKAMGGVSFTSATAYDWLPANAKVAYRNVWRRTNRNNQDVVGAPSGRYVIQNTSGSAARPTITILIPSEVALSGATGADVSWVCQVYRSRYTTADETGSVPDPSDEMFACYEFAYIPATGSFSFVDQTPEPLLQDALYTNESEEGITQARTRPPMCRAIGSFNELMTFGNLTEQYRLPFQLLSVADAGPPAGAGLTANDWVVLGDIAMQASAAETYQYQFLLTTTTGLANAVSRIKATVDRMVFRQNSIVNKRFNSLGIYDGTLYTLNNESNSSDVVGNMSLDETWINGDGWVSWKTPGVRNAVPYIGCTRAVYPSPFSPVPLATGSASPAGSDGIAVAITAFAQSASTVVTVTTGSNHGLAVGDIVNIGMIPFSTTNWTTYFLTGGSYTVATVPTATTFTIAGNVSQTISISSGVAPFNGAEHTAAAALAFCHKVIDNTNFKETQAAAESNRTRNKLMWSPALEPESAPLANFILIGRPDADIVAIKQAGSSLFVFKEDGLFRVFQTAFGLQSEVFSESIRIVGAGTVASYNDVIYCLTTRGVARITEASVEIISQDIEDDINYFVANAFTTSSLQCWGYCDEDGSYTVFAPGPVSSGSDGEGVTSVCNMAFVFDGRGWLKRTDQAVTGCYGVRNNLSGDLKRLYTFKNAPSWMTIERKHFSLTDFGDETIYCTYVSSTSTTVTLTPNSLMNFGTSFATNLPEQISTILSFNGVQITTTNDLGNRRANVSSVSLSSGQLTLTIESAPPGYASIQEFIDELIGFDQWAIQLGAGPEWVWVNDVGSDPAGMRQYSGISLYMDQPWFSTAELFYTTDLYNEETSSSRNTIRGLTYDNQTEYEDISKPIMRPYPKNYTGTRVREKVINSLVPRVVQRGGTLYVGFRSKMCKENISCRGHILRTAAEGKNNNRVAIGE